MLLALLLAHWVTLNMPAACCQHHCTVVQQHGWCLICITHHIVQTCQQHGWCLASITPLTCITHDMLCRHANEGSYGSQKHGGNGNILGFLSVRGMQHFIRLRKFVPINDQLSAELGVDLNVKNQSYFPQAALTYQASHPDSALSWDQVDSEEGM